MEVKEIPLTKLYVSELNVRKTLTSEEDETGINDLANDIRSNGLINPITVRKVGDRYEIIAGQRRFLATKLLDRAAISCSIVDVTTQKAEELSLVENVQRNPMTYSDKVKTYAKLYEVYKQDICKVINVVNISRLTLTKYLKIASLPDEVIKNLDSSGDQKITIEVAVELAKLPEGVDKQEALQNIQTLSTPQKIAALKQFVKEGFTDAEDLCYISEEIVVKDNNIVLQPSYPYVEDTEGKNVRIPTQLFSEIIALILTRCGTIEYC